MSLNPTGFDKFIVRVRESELSLPQIEVLATEILAVSTKEAASALFSVFVHEPGETVTTNLLGLFRELAIRSPAWARVLQKSITKRGRCPRPLVSRVRGVLAEENERLAKEVRSVRDLLADFETTAEPIVSEQVKHSWVSGVLIEPKTQWFRSGKTRATVPVTKELSDIRRMEAMASVIADLTPKPDELCLDFSDVEHVYAVGLAALKAWCEKMEIIPIIINASDTTFKYLDTIGFTRVSERRASQPAQSEPYYAMAIERIVAGSQPESVANKIVNIVDHHMHLSRKNRSGLIVVFAELVENIQRHAGISSPAFACASVPAEAKVDNLHCRYRNWDSRVHYILLQQSTNTTRGGK